MSVEIIPAILPKSLKDLEENLARMHGVTKEVQIDLAPRNVLLGQESMPFWQEFDFEFDLMLPHPEQEVDACVALGGSRIIVHAHNTHAHEAVEILQKHRGGEYPIKVGLALAAHGSVEELKSFSGLYDYVQVMGIDHEGRQGEPPDPHRREVELIKQLRARFPDSVIQVDGGVAPHVRELVVAGANRLVVGSAIIQSENPKKTYQALYTEANNAH